MEPKKIFILSIIIGIIGVMFAYFYLKKKEAILTKGMNLVPVVVAEKDINVKTKLVKNLFRKEYIPERYLMPTSIKYNTEQDLLQIIGKVNIVPISAGQQILLSEIIPPSEEVGLSVNILKNMRGMIIQIDNIDVIDLIKPNDYVDIIAIFNAQHKVKGKVKVASTILQDILVIGVSKDLGAVEEDIESFKKKKKKNRDNFKTVDLMTISLAVTPEQAQILALAKSQGDIVLSIRANNDHDKNQIVSIDSSIFFN